MAKVTVTRRWPDGDTIQVAVKVKTSYPDAVAEATRNALNSFTEAMGVTLSAVDDEADGSK